MSFRSLLGCGSVVGVSLVFVGGCFFSGRRVAAVPSFSPSAAAASAMEQYDTDHDGKLSGAELDACPSIKSALSKLDTGGDKAVTLENLTARMQAWKTGVTRIGVSCTVLRDGKPLADAEVKFVPEKFMGGSFPTATGKTGAGGKTIISLPETEAGGFPGIPFGYYRVEITKGNEIPAKYNTETTLGQEIAVDNPVMRSPDGITFNLKY